MSSEAAACGGRFLGTQGALLAAGIPVLLGLFSGHYKSAFDSYIHMFFADHYLRDWFSLWESRWYGGFSVVGYPPLVHQVLALGSGIFGHELAYVLLVALVMLCLPLSIGYASRVVGYARPQQLWVVVFAAFWPTTHRFAYVYGQLPMLVAANTALWGIAVLDRYFEERRPLLLALFGALIATTASAHHVTTIFAAGGCALVTMKHFIGALGKDSHYGERRRALLGLSKRAGMGASLAGMVTVGIIWPFWGVAGAAPQAEIPHYSRDPIWERGFAIDTVEQVVVLLLALLLTCSALRRRARAELIFALGLLLFELFALGGTTPLPRWVFGAQWRWLTYEKFHLWACLLLPVVGAGVVLRWSEKRVAVPIVLAAVMIPVSMLAVSHRSSSGSQPPYIVDISPALDVLSQPGAERYRHLTLGYGDQFVRLDIYSRSPNVDGNYFTARTDPTLRDSGIATLDASKYYERGPEMLEYILSKAHDLSLRWVLANDEWYYGRLFAAGFQLRELWAEGGALFELPGVLPLEKKQHGQGGPWPILWGVLPLSALALTMFLAFEVRRRSVPLVVSDS